MVLQRGREVRQRPQAQILKEHSLEGKIQVVRIKKFKINFTIKFLDGPGHVHNMAVMLAPQRIDYSVTKVKNHFKILFLNISGWSSILGCSYCIFSNMHSYVDNFFG